MNGPNPYLADMWAAFQPGAALAGYGPPSAAPVQSGMPMPAAPPPPNASGYPSLLEVPSAPAPAPAGPPALPPPPPPPAASLPTDNPAANASMPPPNMSVSPTPPMGVQAGPPPPPEPRADPNAFPLVSAGTASSPAAELERRGPTLLAAQGALNADTAQAIGNIRDRGTDDAGLEYGLALDQERIAREREAAVQQSYAEREEDMMQRQQDFDSSVRQLGRMGNVDHGRFWASRSTPQKIAGVVELMLAGFRGAPSIAMKRIEDDVKAQEFAYMAARDQAQAKQSAFSMAMAKWQNLDAARATARAASIDVMQARLAQLSAQHRGTEIANRADMAWNDLQREKVAQIQAGIQFIPAQSRGRMWVDPRTGLTYSEAEAKQIMAKRDDWGQADRTLAAGVGGQIAVKATEQMLDQQMGGLTREQRGKLMIEEAEKNKESQEFNEQIDYAKEHPALRKLGLSVGPMSTVLGPRIAPDAVKTTTDLDTLNTQILNAIGKVAKDSEGKPNQNMLKMYKERFEIKPSDTKDIAVQKLEGARTVVNSLARQRGAEAPRPGGDVRAGDLPASATLYGGKR